MANQIVGNSNGHTMDFTTSEIMTVQFLNNTYEKQDNMCKRFVAIWFYHLKTDWMIRHKPDLVNVPFVLAIPDHGRMVITEVSVVAKRHGLHAGMIVADAKVTLPEVEVFDDKPELANKLLQKLALWCIRYTPVVSVDSNDSLILDVSGCTHLWGTDENYLHHIIGKLKGLGYHVRASMADTIGTACVVCRY